MSAANEHPDQQLVRRTLLKLTAGAGLAPFLASLAGSAGAAQNAAAASSAYTPPAPGATHRLVPSWDSVGAGQMSPSVPTALQVRSGDVVHYDGTWTQWGNEAKFGMSFDEREPIRKRYPNGPYSLIGPVGIEGAMPGDVIECKLLKMRLIGWGWNSAPRGVGALPDDFKKPYLRYLKFDEARKHAEFVPGVSIPLAPFQGVFAVQPVGDQPVSGILAGAYGGNLVLPELVENTSLFLPVQVPGARVWTGDTHAAQGDGVVNQTAIESALEEMRVQYVLHPKVALRGPMVETPTHWIAVGFGDSLDGALVSCLRQMLGWMSAATGIPMEDCYGICSVGASFRVTQYANQTGTVYRSVPPKGIHCLLPKSLFDARLQARLARSLRA